MATNYPSALDDFAGTSPANLGDDDSKGRKHDEKHNDVELAVEAIETELGTDPAGDYTTVKDRLTGFPRRLTWASGEYMGPSSAQNSGMWPPVGYLYAAPFFNPVAFTADRLQVYVQTGEATSVIRLGVYANGTGDRPGALLVDAGTVDTATSGLKDATISTSIPAGLVWLVATAQTQSSTLRIYQSYAGFRVPGSAAGADAAGVGILKDGVTGTLSDPFGTPTVIGAASVPSIAIRKA